MHDVLYVRDILADELVLRRRTLEVSPKPKMDLLRAFRDKEYPRDVSRVAVVAWPEPRQGVPPRADAGGLAWTLRRMQPG